MPETIEVILAQPTTTSVQLSSSNVDVFLPTVGPAGPVGPIGPTGVQGPSGVQGAAGFADPNQVVMVTGAQGVVGKKTFNSEIGINQYTIYFDTGNNSLNVTDSNIVVSQVNDISGFVNILQDQTVLGRKTFLRGAVFDSGVNFSTGVKVGIGTVNPQHDLDIYNVGGLIVGMTHLNPTAEQTVVLGTGYSSIDSTAKISFTSPSNGKILIEGSAFTIGNSRPIFFRLQTETGSNNSLGSEFEKEFLEVDETDNSYTHPKWLVSGLVPGSGYTYYLAAKHGSTAFGTQSVNWGGTSSDKFPPLIIKAVTVPNSIYLG